jgi:hypothetical protein
MTTYGQELTLFGGWAKAQIPPPIKIGVEKPLGTFSSSIYVNPVPSIDIQCESFTVYYNGKVYQNEVDARWAVFFDHVGSPFSYSRIDTGVGAIYAFVMPFNSHILTISTKPADSENERERWLDYIRSSSAKEVRVLKGSIWNKDLRSFKCMRYKRTSNIYGNETPNSTSGRTLFDQMFTIYVRPLEMNYGLHIWIIQGHLFLYLKGKITEYLRDPARPDGVTINEETLTWLGVRKDASLYKHLAILNTLQEYIHMKNMREGSYFLRTEDVYSVDDQQEWRDCGGPHHVAVDDFILPDVRSNHSKIAAAYTAARLATFRPPGTERLESPLQRVIAEVQQDQVVQEVIRLFGATIKDVMVKEPIVAQSAVRVSEPSSISAASQPAGESVTTTGVPRLTIAEVKVRWEAVLRRIKSKKDGAMVAAVLRGYDIVGVDGRADLLIVILKAHAAFHYRNILERGHRSLIEEACKVELEQECRVCLFPPKAPKYPLSEQSGISAVSQLTGESVITTETSGLTIAKVKERWGYVLRRIKAMKDGPMIAALLNGL